MNIPLSILAQLAAEIDTFPGGPTTDLVNSHSEALSSLIEEAMTRLARSIDKIDELFTTAEIGDYTPQGIEFRCVRFDGWDRHMGTYWVKLTWAELLDENVSAGNLAKEKWQAFQDEKTRKLVEAGAKEAAAQAKRVEIEERAQLLRLREKYGQ